MTIDSYWYILAIYFNVDECNGAGSGGGAGWVGGNGGTEDFYSSQATLGSPGTSFIAAAYFGTCRGLSGNSGDGYVIVTAQ